MLSGFFGTRSGRSTRPFRSSRLHSGNGEPANRHVPRKQRPRRLRAPLSSSAFGTQALALEGVSLCLDRSRRDVAAALLVPRGQREPMVRDLFSLNGYVGRHAWGVGSQRRDQV